MAIRFRHNRGSRFFRDLEMMKALRSCLLATVVAVSISACGTPMGGPGGRPAGGQAEDERGVGRGVCRSPIDQLQEQLAETALALKLTPRQVVLWEAYQAGVRRLMADQVKREIYALASRSALNQINGKVDVVRNRLAAMEEVAELATALYQALDGEQQRVADQRLAGTVPALYSGLSCQGGDAVRSGERGGPGQGGRGGPGGMGGGGMGRF